MAADPVTRRASRSRPPWGLRSWARFILPATALVPVGLALFPGIPTLWLVVSTVVTAAVAIQGLWLASDAVHADLDQGVDGLRTSSTSLAILKPESSRSGRPEAASRAVSRWVTVAGSPDDGAATADRVRELEQALESLRAEMVMLEQQKYALDQHSIVAMTDVRGNILYANDRFCAISGYTREELLGRNHRILNSGHHRPELWTELYQTVASGRVWRAELKNRARSGRFYWVDTTVVPLIGPDGKPHRYIAIRTEITDRKQAEADLKAAMEMAHAGHHAKSQFLATVSHELRTPLNAVLGFTGLLLDTGLNAEQREYAQTVQESGAQLLKLIAGLLDLSSLEAGQFVLESRDYRLDLLAGEVMESLRPRAEAANLAIALDPAPAPEITLVGDPSRVRQVLMHLVENAIKFTPSGSVRVRLTHGALPKPGGGLASAASPDNGPVRLEIIDTGIGIPPGQGPALFESLTVGDNSSTRRFGGTGTGLATCRKLVTLMGGDVGFSSKPGEGSVFWFTLPRKAPATPARPSDAPAPSSSAGSLQP